MRIVCVWAWWTWISWLVHLFCSFWREVVAIDAHESLITNSLRTSWAQVVIWHGKYIIDINDIVIYSDVPSIVAWPEIVQAYAHQKNATRKNFHRPRSYNQIIAEITKYCYTIAIAWSNGKSSITSMTINAMANTFWDRFWLWIVWAQVPDWNMKNILYAKDKVSVLKQYFSHFLDGWSGASKAPTTIKDLIFVIEACEYKNHYHLYDIDWAIISNIQADHLDFFENEENYLMSFKKFTQRVRNYVITNKETAIKLWTDCKQNILVADSFDDQHQIQFTHLIWDIHQENASLLRWLLTHLSNTQTCVLSDTRRNILSNSPAIWRRMEYIWKIWKNISVYSDYAHHPPAIITAYNSLSQHLNKQITLLFQVHQIYRLLSHRDDFLKVLAIPKKLLIYAPYSAREQLDILLWLARKNLHKEFKTIADIMEYFCWFLDNAQYFPDRQSLQTYIEGEAEDTILLCTAWDLDDTIRKISNTQEKNI